MASATDTLQAVNTKLRILKIQRLLLFASNYSLPRSFLFAALAAGLLFGAGCSPSTKIPVEGSVFIVTKDSTNLKLGLVQVELLEEAQVSAAILDSQSAIQAEHDAMTARHATIRKDAQERSKDLDALKNVYQDWRKYARLQDERWARELDELLAENARERQADVVSPLRTVENEVANWPVEEAKLVFGKLSKSDVVTKTDADGKFYLNAPRAGKYIVAARAERQVGSGNETYFWLFRLEVVAPKVIVHLSNDNLVESHPPESVVPTRKWDAQQTNEAPRSHH
jgi:hypothetical protein